MQKQSWRIDLGWDGAGFCGWQKQPNQRSIQDTLEQALRQLFGEDIHAFAAGRTDAGVHAIQQVVSFEAQNTRDEKVVYRALNALLPKDICCLLARKMPVGFRARSASKSKLYRYRILNRDIPDPLRRTRVWWIRDRLHRDVLDLSIHDLIGTYDFCSFQASRCNAQTTIRTIDSFSVVEKEDEIHFEVIGKGFLRHQVRIMVGTLVDLARGSLKNTSMKQIRMNLDRRTAGITAPSHGLYLVWTVLHDDEKHGDSRLGS